VLVGIGIDSLVWRQYLGREWSRGITEKSYSIREMVEELYLEVLSQWTLFMSSITSA
jgi:hypothetical protein